MTELAGIETTRMHADDDLREKVAKALYEADVYDQADALGAGFPRTWPPTLEATREGFLAYADAALRAATGGSLVHARTVEIPATKEHDGQHRMRVTLLWRCPRCGGPRGAVTRGISYDGSRRLGVDTWTNPCGHVDTYDDARREAEPWR